MRASPVLDCGYGETRVELAQIQYFLTLCETRNFTQAARQCGVSQPSLSNAIRALERGLGGPLIRRSPFALTPLGKAVRPHLKTALRHIVRARTAAQIDAPKLGASSHAETHDAPPHGADPRGVEQRTA